MRSAEAYICAPQLMEERKCEWADGPHRRAVLTIRVREQPFLILANCRKCCGEFPVASLSKLGEAMKTKTRSVAATMILAALGMQAASAETLPTGIDAPGETAAMKVYAEGAQVYECKADQTGKLAWEFREPVATLLLDGKTVGRHYAGPHWEMLDGSIIQGKVAGRAPGATVADIPWLKLNVSAQRGQGQLTSITTIQRINTKGGALEGACDKAGAFRSVAYSTDYVFLKK
jgi:Protein of unknown function (DUF3455)